MTGAPYLPKPFRMDPVRESGFRMGQSRKDQDSWMDRMAQRYTIVEVRCSTEPQPEDEPLHVYKRHEPQEQAFISVKVHMKALDELGALQPGRYCISIPGSDRKHSFEVE